MAQNPLECFRAFEEGGGSQDAAVSPTSALEKRECLKTYAMGDFHGGKSNHPQKEGTCFITQEGEKLSALNSFTFSI